METPAPFWLFVLNYLIISAVALHSGLYLDNGRDQTIVQRSLSLREQQHFEMDLLDLLGLQSRPRITRSTSIRSAGHKYLLDLYKSQLDAPAGSESNVAELDLSIIETSDAIISLKNLYYFNFNETGDDHQLKLWFDVTTIPPSVDGIIRAELRIYQSSLSTLPEGKLYTVAVQQILENDNGDRISKLVTNVTTTSGFQGWLSFNVSGPLADWMIFNTNLGLYVEAYDPSSPNIIVDLADLGVAKGAHPSSEAEDEPFMIVFMQGEHRRAPRVRRQSSHRKKKNENSETPNINPLTDPSMAHSWSQSLRSCQIQSLFVNFSDLKWQDWIIAPVGYSAFYCSGECNFPLNAHMNATNHAIVQTLVNLMNPTKVPRPCCAPTKLTPISVLYFVDDNNVILKKYKNMVVKSCGCH